MARARDAMERAVYAQGWFERGWNYHPSLPPRRLKMVDDFVAYRATMLTWPSLGGGPISLAYLEDEAFAPVPARYRQYGFLTDAEFVAECRARGVLAFSVVFSTQGWEFPVELNDAEDEVLAMNELRGAGRRGWLGLREFTQNRYPKLWEPFERYFPEGLRNSRGEIVTDLFEECAGRDIDGNALHADWLEVPAREASCHYMCIDNPVWREYLKAIVRIHVDAGVDGIQFDEPDSPISGLRYGGCFCPDCLGGFADFLGRPGFDYRDHLRARGLRGWEPDALDDVDEEYARFLQGRVAVNFAELAGYARDYARSRGREVLVSANLYDAAPWTDPMASVVDVLVPEQRHTLYRQPGWMRFLAGWAGGRPACVSFNPYGGVIPELVPELRAGRALDRYRVMLLEAAAMGVNLSVPYGAWMGAMIEDAMWAPHPATVAIQDFLADHEHLYEGASLAESCVVYSTDSAFLPLTKQGALQARIDPVTKRRGERGAPIAFFRVVEELGDAGVPLDVVVFHDGRLREDDASAEQLARYARIVLPDCTRLTPRQADAVLGALDAGAHVSVVGELGSTELPAVAAILAHPGCDRADGPVAIADLQLVLDAGREPTDVGAHVVATFSGIALHLVNYGYDAGADRFAAVPRLGVAVRLPAAVSGDAFVHAPGAEPVAVDVRMGDDGRAWFVVPDLGAAAIVELRTA